VLGANASRTVVVAPLGSIAATVTQGWNDCAVTGHPLGVVTVTDCWPPPAAVFERSGGATA
jgi:hypothetical protein